MKEREDVCKVIAAFGAFKNYSGYQYTIKAVSIYMEKETSFSDTEKSVYHDVAAFYDVKRENVYRDMLTFCKAVWKRKPELIKSLSDVALTKRPSVSDFVHLLANPLMRNKIKV